MWGLWVPLWSGIVNAMTTPVVILHGMGDSGQSDGMLAVKRSIEDAKPGVFVHNIVIGSSPFSDRIASFYDDLNRQVNEISQQLKSIPELRHGFHAIGFSQGAQILRAYVQRYNNPPVRNLISIGGQHQGVCNFPGCSEDVDPIEETTSMDIDLNGLDRVELTLQQVIFPSLKRDCSWWQRMIKEKVYTDSIQHHIVQAQYYKDPRRLEEYLAKSNFLADINNERPAKNITYAKNIAKLDNLVLYMFEDDSQVVPKESAWFGFHDGRRLWLLYEQPIYKEDWIGLRQLDQRGALHFLKIPGSHMQIPKNFFTEEGARWLADEDKSFKMKIGQ